MHVGVTCGSLNVRAWQAEFNEIQLFDIELVNIRFLLVEQRGDDGTGKHLPHMLEIVRINTEDIDGQPEGAGVL